MVYVWYLEFAGSGMHLICILPLLLSGYTSSHHCLALPSLAEHVRHAHHSQRNSNHNLGTSTSILTSTTVNAAATMTQLGIAHRVYLMWLALLLNYIVGEVNIPTLQGEPAGANKYKQQTISSSHTSGHYSTDVPCYHGTSVTTRDDMSHIP